MAINRRQLVENKELVSLVIIGGSILLAIAFGVATPRSPELVVLPLAVMGGSLLFADANARLAFLVFAGLTALGSSSGLSLIKIVYLLGSGFALALAVARVQSNRNFSMNWLMNPLFRLATLWGVGVAISLAVAVNNAVSPTMWIRDVIPYILFATIPIFARDAVISGHRQAVLVCLLASGSLAAIGFSVTFLNSRGYASLPIEHLVLPSVLLPAATFSYAVSAALHGRRFRLLWMALAATILTFFLITGTRTSFIFLAAPVATALCISQGRWRRLLSLLIGSLAFALMLIFFGQTLADALGVDFKQVVDRLSTITNVLETESTAGQSFDARSNQTDVAWRAFLDSPIFGVGPGTVFEWSDRFGTYSGISLDSPVGFPAKFGIFGVLILCATIIEYALLIIRIRRRGEISVPWLAMVGFSSVVGLWMVLGSPFEDKGFSFGFLLLLTLTLMESHNAKPLGPRGPGSPKDIPV